MHISPPISSCVGAKFTADGKAEAIDGKLYYCGYDVDAIVQTLMQKKHFGFEQVSYLLLHRALPDMEALDQFKTLIRKNRLLLLKPTCIRQYRRVSLHCGEIYTEELV